MTRRVCFALGTWQIVTLAAGLRRAADDSARGGSPFLDYLVLYEPAGASDALKDSMQAVAEAVWPWKRIVWAFDVLSGVRRRVSQERFDALLGGVRERVGVPAVDELWFCWLNRLPEKLIMEAYPDARVVLYEDGLTTYLPVPVPPAPHPAFARLTALLTRRMDARRPVRRFRRHKNVLDPRHQERLAGLYLVLADVLPVPAAFAHPPCHLVGDHHLRETLRSGAAIAGLADAATGAPGDARPRVLVLGQSLHRWGVLTREQELAVYGHTVDALLAKGYNVLWKEHPRVLEPFFPQLAAGTAERRRRDGDTAGTLRELDLPFALPVELVAGRLGLAGCVAGISAALFYLPRLHDIPAYTFAGDLSPFMTRHWAVQNEMVTNAVPPLSALPAAANRVPSSLSGG